jgi:alkylation response protein AidB-like acyl-CoA dehydrogenase
VDENGFDFALRDKLAETGILGLHIPEEYGGGGCTDEVTTSLVLHEIAKGSASVAVYVNGHWMAANNIQTAGTPEQKATYLPLAAEGTLFAFSLTEPSGGSDAAGIKTRAVFDEKTREWVVSGSKAWITNGGVAEVYVITAKTDPEAGSRGISDFIVPAGTPGFSVGKHEDKMGTRGCTATELSFDSMRLPENALLGEINRGFKLMMAGLDGGRTHMTAIISGLAEHAVAIAKKYANERVTFGKTLAEHQAIQFKFADMSTAIHAMELMFKDTAEALDAGKRQSIEAAQAKLFAAGNCMQICTDCVQILGGNGYSREYHVERLMRDAKMMQIGDGTDEILRMVIGRGYLKS